MTTMTGLDAGGVEPSEPVLCRSAGSSWSYAPVVGSTSDQSTKKRAYFEPDVDDVVDVRLASERR